MARAISNKRKAINTAVAVLFGSLMFFPIMWLVILSFKTEVNAIRAPLEVLMSGWTLNLTAAKAAPLTAFIASYSSPEGLFYTKLSVASIMAIGPILIMEWFSQKPMVRGLKFGAVK